MLNRTLAAFAAGAVLFAGAAHAACDTTGQVEQCKGQLAAGYDVLNTYALDGQDGKITSVVDDNVLSSRMSYQLVICGADGVTFELQSGARKPLLNNKEGDSLQTMLTIEPERSSVYYLAFGLPAADTCGAAVLGVKAR